MKYCPNCGAGLQDEMRFCPKCGKRHQDAAVGVEDFEVSDRTEEAHNIPEPPVAVETQKTKVQVQVYEHKKKSKAPAIIVVCLLMLAIAGAAVFFLGRGAVDNEDKVALTANSVLYLEVFDDKQELTATASGFVIEDGTTLVTNYHVIEDAYHIIAWTPDGEKSVDVSNIITYDENADLAVLKCDENIGVQPLVLGDSDPVKQGDTVYAVGYPLGLAHTLSDGVISSRYVDDLGTDVLQITAAISSGSSGGALLDEHGAVIGIVCASYLDGQNLNLAITANELKTMLSEAKKESSLKEWFMANKPILGTSLVNFIGGGRYVDNSQYSYKVVNADYSSLIYTDYKKIVQHKKDGSEKRDLEACFSPDVLGLNIYKDRLYWFEKGGGIRSCPVGEKFGRKTIVHDFIGDNEYIFSMLVANEKCFCIYSPGKFECIFAVFDLSTGEKLMETEGVLDFVFDDEHIYFDIDGENQLYIIDMKTLESETIDFVDYHNVIVKNLSEDGTIYLAAENNNGYFLVEYDTVLNTYCETQTGEMFPARVLIFKDLTLVETRATSTEIYQLKNGEWVLYDGVPYLPFYYWIEDDYLTYLYDGEENKLYP